MTPDPSSAPGDGDAAHWPRVTAAILAYNRRSQLATTLRVLRDDVDYPGELEVVVVDNASTDGTAEMVRHDHPQVRLIVSDRNVGVSGWNRALAVAEGDYVLVLDDDCYPEGSALRTAVAEAQREGADLVSFYVRSLGEGRDFSEEVVTGLLSFWGCAALLSRQAIERLGGFDPNIFIWAHEVEFTMRLLDSGLAHLHLPNAAALHQKGGAEDFSMKGWRLNARNHGYIAASRLRWRDAVTGLVNYAAHVVGEGLHHPERLAALSDLGAGALSGVRRRAPVRPEISRLYRRNFLAFASPFLHVRSPAERWRGRGDAMAPGRDSRRKLAAFYAARPCLYPDGRSVLRLPPGDPQPV